MDTATLVKIALNAKARSYSPYSKFRVGAALLTSADKVYIGSNIESASYSPSNCAERTAFFTAVCAGERDFAKIAIIGGLDNQATDYCYPCGVCRQVMMEFCNPESFIIIVAKDENDFKEHLLKELLPFGFGAHNLL